MPSQFLQSREWQKLQESLGRKTDLSEDGLILFLPLRFKKQYAYMPRGPIAGLGQLPERLNTLIKRTGKQSSIFFRVEPPLEDNTMHREILRSLGFKEVQSIQPEETFFINLNRSEVELLAGMEHNTRYAIRTAERRSVTISIAERSREKRDRFDEFWELFRETNKRHRLDSYGKRYYEAVAALEGDCRSKLFIAYLDGKPISVALFVYYRETATYLFAASAKGYGKYNAPSLVLWKAVQDAKKDRCAVLDLWGASSSKKEWAGLSAFKKSFGGTAFRFVGTWDYVFDKTWYCFYKAAKQLAALV